MIVQMSFIDRNTAETWTISHEFDSFHDVTDYLLGHPPENIAVHDTFLVHVMVEDGVNLYYQGWQGNWVLINDVEYEKTWEHDFSKAIEAKKRMDELRASGCVKPWVPETAEARAKLEKIRQSNEDAPRRRKERYQVA